MAVERKLMILIYEIFFKKKVNSHIKTFRINLIMNDDSPEIEFAFDGYNLVS